MSAACSLRFPKTCTIWLSSHAGSIDMSVEEDSTTTNSTIQPNSQMKVFLMSMAGPDGVENLTEMGPIKMPFSAIKPESRYLTESNVDKLQRRSVEYGVHTLLVPNIYAKTPECTDMGRPKLEELLKETLALETLADIKYTHPPTIIEDPRTNKVYFIEPHKDETTRQDVGNDPMRRSNPPRLSGDPFDNMVYRFYGINILHTSDDEHARFAISNMPVNEDGFVHHEDIMNGNILTKHNYDNFWKKHLTERDFTGVPDEFVSDMGDDAYVSVAIFKKFCADIGMTKSKKVRVNYPEHIKKIHDAVKVAVGVIKTTTDLVIETQERVSDVRAEIVRTADVADAVEGKYNELAERRRTRLLVSNIEPELKAKIDAADAIWEEARRVLVSAKAADAEANEAAQQAKNAAAETINAAIKQCIDNIISSSDSPAELKKLLKNIIMSNKLRNILKLGILNKRISLNQIILFFRGLEYKILCIGDPACSRPVKLKNPLEAVTVRQVDTQELGDSSFQKSPWIVDILNFIETELLPPSLYNKSQQKSNTTPLGKKTYANYFKTPVKDKDTGKSPAVKGKSPAVKDNSLEVKGISAILNERPILPPPFTSNTVSVKRQRPLAPDARNVVKIGSGTKRKKSMRSYSRKRRTCKKRYTRRRRC